jgi:hypothetical protein
MTIQNWELSPDRALVVCDSLGTSAETNLPAGFMQKAWPIAHRGAIVAGKDWVAPSLGLYVHLLEPFVFDPGFDAVIRSAAEAIRAVVVREPELARRSPGAKAGLFMWCRERQRIVGAQFRAAANYEPEVIPDGRWLLPEMPDEWALNADWGSLVIEQQRRDRLLEPLERDNIGGTLFAYELTAPEGRPRIVIHNMGEMPFVDEDLITLTGSVSAAGG